MRCGNKNWVAGSKRTFGGLIEASMYRKNFQPGMLCPRYGNRVSFTEVFSLSFEVECFLAHGNMHTFPEVKLIPYL
jgi:hypothetical protein